MTIIAAGMRRGGSTLQFQLIGDILAAAKFRFSSGWRANIADADLMQNCPADNIRLIKTHGIPSCCSKALRQPSVRIFYASRDPRDSLISYLRKYDIPFSFDRATNFLSLLGTEYRFWTAQRLTHWTRYEAMFADLESEVMATAAALNVRLTAAEISSIVEKRSLLRQSQAIAAFDWEDKALRIGIDSIDPKSLLHSNHIAGGIVDGWKSQLTAEAILSIEAQPQHAKLIVDLGYLLSTSWLHRTAYRLASAGKARLRPLLR